MALSATQQIVAQDTTRFKVVCAGRRWGKTTLAIRELCKIAAIPLTESYYIAPSYRMAKTIVWRKLINKLKSLNWIKSYHKTELSITLVNGSTISLKGADNPDSLRGVSLNLAILDEFAYMDEDVWYQVIRPALSDQEGSALFITTPISKSNWAYDLFQMQSKHSNWKSFTFTTLDGGFVSEDEVLQARAELDERTFRQEYEASFESYGNVIAYNFNRDTHVKPYAQPLPRDLHIGIDFNTSPITAAVYVKEGDTLYEIDEIYMNDSNTQELCDEINSRYPNNNIFVYPDPSGIQRKTSANGNTDFSILANAGFTIKAPRAHDLVRDRINAFNSRLKSSDGKYHLYIDPKCRHSIESCEKFSYKDNTQTPNKATGYDHLFDAMSYAVAFMFPIKRITERKPAQSFGHRVI